VTSPGRPGTAVYGSIGRTFCRRAVIEEAIGRGLAGCRLALGLADRDHVADLAVVRQAEAAGGRALHALLDLPSTRPRTGRMAERAFVPGEAVRFEDREAESGGIVPLPGLVRHLAAIEPGHRLLFRDGRQQFRITDTGPGHLEAVCLAASEALQASNGVTFPDSAVGFAPLRGEDVGLLGAMRDDGLRPDSVAMSFAATAGQVEELREALADLWPENPPAVVAKVETRAGLERADALMRAADGLLMGRGDLGLSVAPETLPAAQEGLSRLARNAGKPLVVATQILEVFARGGEPYRAELSDLALMARQGVAAALLCAETNDSPRPVECVGLARAVLDAEAALARSG
jgi:pyruvate kinase